MARYCVHMDAQQTAGEAIAHNIEKYIAARGSSRTHVFQSAGMSRQSFERSMKGTRPFTIAELIGVARAVGVNVAALFPVSGQMSSRKRHEHRRNDDADYGCQSHWTNGAARRQGRMADRRSARYRLPVCALPPHRPGIHCGRRTPDDRRARAWQLVGIAFASARRRRLIECVGITAARSKSRNGGSLKVWKAA